MSGIPIELEQWLDERRRRLPDSDGHVYWAEGDVWVAVRLNAYWDARARLVPEEAASTSGAARPPARAVVAELRVVPRAALTPTGGLPSGVTNRLVSIPRILAVRERHVRECMEVEAETTAVAVMKLEARLTDGKWNWDWQRRTNDIVRARRQPLTREQRLAIVAREYSAVVGLGNEAERVATRIADLGGESKTGRQTAGDVIEARRTGLLKPRSPGRGKPRGSMTAKAIRVLDQMGEMDS